MSENLFTFPVFEWTKLNTQEAALQLPVFLTFHTAEFAHCDSKF